jgi:hypothetical protein
MSAEQESSRKTVSAPERPATKESKQAAAGTAGVTPPKSRPGRKARGAKGGRAKSPSKPNAKGARGRAGGQQRSAEERLRPGGLDSIVIADLRKRQGEWPLTASAVGKSVGRSGGAVANCLERLAKGKKVRRAKLKPRSYDLKGL